MIITPKKIEECQYRIKKSCKFCYFLCFSFYTVFFNMELPSTHNTRINNGFSTCLLYITSINLFFFIFIVFFNEAPSPPIHFNFTSSFRRVPINWFIMPIINLAQCVPVYYQYLTGKWTPYLRKKVIFKYLIKVKNESYLFYI